MWFNFENQIVAKTIQKKNGLNNHFLWTKLDPRHWDTEIPWRLHLLGVVLREKAVTRLVRELTTAGVSTVQGVSCLSPGFCPASNPKDQQIQNVPPHGPEVYFSQDEDLEMAPEMFQFGWSLSHIGSLDQLPIQTQLPTYTGSRIVLARGHCTWWSAKSWSLRLIDPIARGAWIKSKHDQ